MLGVGERPGVAGERGRRSVTARNARTPAGQQDVVATERLSEVLHAGRVDEVVDGAVGVQQETHCRPVFNILAVSVMQRSVCPSVCLVFRSTSPSRHNKVGLKCPSVRPFDRTHTTSYLNLI